jgi:hypothetical protein
LGKTIKPGFLCALLINGRGKFGVTIFNLYNQLAGKIPGCLFG